MQSAPAWPFVLFPLRWFPLLLDSPRLLVLANPVSPRISCIATFPSASVARRSKSPGARITKGCRKRMRAQQPSCASTRKKAETHLRGDWPLPPALRSRPPLSSCAPLLREPFASLISRSDPGWLAATEGYQKQRHIRACAACVSI